VILVMRLSSELWRGIVDDDDDDDEVMIMSERSILKIWQL